MTKEELRITMAFLSSIRSAISELKSYGRDYNNSTISDIGIKLESSIEEFIKKF